MVDDARRIATERIKILFTLAERFHIPYPERAQRYSELARRIASRNRVHLPRELRRRVCPGCKSYMGSTSSRTRIRQTREPHVTITCLRCGYVTRIPLRSKKT
ncbi:MAG: ribonuclease P [Candidatus Bathyarchaeota archaeon]|nr:ribonuclease P [Candidatus Bathyarchaeota archaeon]